MKRRPPLKPVQSGRVSNALNRRLEERRRYRVKFWIITVLVAVLVVAAAAGLVYLLYFSKVTALSAKKVTFSGGQDVVKQSAVEQAVNPYVGMPLLKVDTAAIAQSLETEPWVSKAEVSRKWPRGLKITFTLRKPVAILQTDNTPLLDGSGQILYYRKQAAGGLPTVTVPFKGQQADKVCLDAALGVWKVLPADLQKKIKLVKADTADTVTLELSDHKKVMWGENADNDLKLKVLKVMLPKGGKEFDISDPVHPSVI